MKAIILAAGKGNRLRPITDEIPKALVEVQGKPIILHQIDALRECNVHDIIVVTGYKKEQMMKAMPDGVEIINNDIYDKSNSIYSLWLARKHLDEEVLLLNSDVVFLQGILQKVLTAKADNVIPVDTGQELKYGELNVIIDEQNRIIRISLDVPVQEAYGVSAQIIKLDGKGAALFRSRVSDVIDANNVNTYPVLVLNELLDTLTVYAIDIAGDPWIEIDTREDLIKAQKIKLY